MKKTVSLICFLTCLALILPLALVDVAFGSPEQFDETFLGELHCKMERLESIDSPKIIVIGGSSTAFGIRSDLMEEELGMPVVNFGLYASLGTKIMLDLSKANIGEGDIIVIAPEQDAQTLSNYFNADSAWKALDGHYEYLKYLDTADLPSMAGNLMSFAAEKYKYHAKGEKPSVSGVYTKEAFNEYGDISYERKSNTMFGGFDANNPISFDCDIISPEFVDYLNEYSEYAQKRGATVYFSFSPMNRAALAESTDSDDIYAYFRHLQNELDFPVISSPELYLMDSAWFYDSNFHMNDSGAILHTKHLVNDLILAMGLDKVCTIEDPEMPAAPEQGTNGEQAEKELFIVSESDSGIQIVGLTEYGASQSVIEVPSEIDGKTVLAIAQGAFSVNTNLTQLTLNDGLTYIANGAFSGCTSLSRLVVNFSDPEKVRVDEDLLEGAENCLIYVPSGKYGVYANDYYWAYFCDLDLIVEN